MFRKKKSFKMRLAAGLLALVLAATSFDITAFAGDYEDVSGNETFVSEDISENEPVEIEEAVPGDEEKIADVSEGEITEEVQEEEKAPYIGSYRRDIFKPYRAPEYVPGDEESKFNDMWIPSAYPASASVLKNSNVDTYLNNHLPATRDQNPWGSCWAHGALATAEASMIAKGYATTDVNYSELALAYFFYNHVTDPLGGTAGDNTTLKSNNKGLSYYQDNYLSMGGNNIFTWRTLASWVGATEEKGAAVYNNGYYAPASIPSEYAYDDAAILKNVRILNQNSEFGREAVKAAIMEYGAVACSYLHDGNYFDAENNSYYNKNAYMGGGHAVSIVGWDDNFSRYNFKNYDYYYGWENVTAPGNGAWLIRNSWVTESQMNQSSYFWMSYYDASLNDDDIFVQEFVPAYTYDHNYQYDGGTLGGSSGKTKVANIFTVNNADGLSEILKAVSFASTEFAGVSYTIKVYTDVTATNPESGNLVATMEGVTDYAGYYTVDLYTPVIMENGTRYSVVIETKNGTVDSEFNYTSNSWISNACAIKAGQSFYYDGSWKDWKGQKIFGCNVGNMCIKAFTTDASGGDAYSILFSPNGGDGEIWSAAYSDSNVTMPICEFTREGYDFMGWSKTPDGENDLYQPYDMVNIEALFGDVVYLYAIWRPYSYSVSFDSANPAAEGEMITVERSVKDGKFTIPACTFTLKGYQFTGWTCEAYDGGDKLLIPGVSIALCPDSDNKTYTFVANWEEKNYLVTLNANGGKAGKIAKVNVDFGDDYSGLYENDCRPSKSGYKFLGWYTSKTGGKLVDKNETVGAIGNITLYARYYKTTEVVPVTFYVPAKNEDESGLNVTESCIKGQPYSVVLNAEGYAVRKELITRYYTGLNEYPLDWYSDEEFTQQVTNSTVVTKTAAHTVYGTNLRIVTLDLDGGFFESGRSTVVKVPYGETIGNLETPVKAYCEFTGWYIPNESLISLNFTAITENVTITADWNRKYTVDTPIISINSAEYDNTGEILPGDSIHITCTTPGAVIYYKLDSYTTYDEEWREYKGEIAVSAEDALGNFYVYAKAVKQDYTDSDVAEEFFSNNRYEVWGDIEEKDKDGYYATVSRGLWIGTIDEVSYTGAAITPTPNVYYYKTKLDKSQYSLSYKNNIKAGEASITVTAKGNFAGTYTKTFTIGKADIGGDKIVINSPNVKHQNKAGTAYSDVRVVGLNGAVLKKNADYTVKYYYGTTTWVNRNGVEQNVYLGEEVELTDIVPVDTYIYPEITGINNYEGTKSGDPYAVLTDVKATLDISKASVTVSRKFIYDGSVQYINSADFTVKVSYKEGGKTKSVTLEPSEYDVKLYSGVLQNAGSVDVTIIAKWDGGSQFYYVGSKTVKVTVAPVNISDQSVQVIGKWNDQEYDLKTDKPNLVYTPGKDTKPGVKLILNGSTVLTEGVDYTVTYQNEKTLNKKKLPKITVKGIGNMTGSISQTYFPEIYDISQIEPGYCNPAGHLFATGRKDNEYKAHLSILTEGYYLVEGKDYTIKYVSYERNGAAPVKLSSTYVSQVGDVINVEITGMNFYKGKLTYSYTLEDWRNRPDGIYRISSGDVVYNGRAGAGKPAISLEVQDSYGYWTKLTADDFTVTGTTYVYETVLKDGTIRFAGDSVEAGDIIPVGTQLKACVTVKNDYSNEMEAVYKVVAGDISKAKVTISGQTYTGKSIVPLKSQITVKIGKTVVSPSDYDIEVPDGTNVNTAVGTGKITIVGTGNYTGKKAATFKIAKKSVKVTFVFDKNGGTGSMKSQQIEVGKTLTLSPFNFKKSGNVSSRDGYVWTITTELGSFTAKDREKITLDADNFVGGNTYIVKANWYEFDDITNVEVTKPALVANAFSQQVVSWNKIPYADSYVVYQATSANGKYTKIGTSKTNSLTVSKLKANTTYYYKVAIVASDTINKKKTNITSSMSTVYGFARTNQKASLTGKVTSVSSSYLYATLMNNGSYDIVFDDEVTNAYVNGVYWYGWYLYSMEFALDVVYAGGSYYDDTLASKQSMNLHWDVLYDQSMSEFTYYSYYGQTITLETKFTYDGIYYNCTVNNKGKISVTPVSYATANHS